MTSSEHQRFVLTRWTIFVLLVISYMTVFFHRMAPGVVASDLMQAFHTSGAALGSLAAMYYYIYTAMQLPSGVLADTLGPRVSVSMGALVAGLGSLLFAWAPDFSTAAAGRLLVGLGVSVVFVSLMKSNTQWFRERQYGLVSGLTVLLGHSGSILSAAPLAFLLETYSWRDVFTGAGIISLILALVTYAFVRNRPEDAGFRSLREMEGRDAHPQRHQHWLRDLHDVFRTPGLWPGFWAHFGVTGALFAFAGLWGVPLMRDVFDLSRSYAALYTTACLIGLALGSFATGWFSDHWGRRKPVVVGACLVSCLIWLAMIVLPWGPGVWGYTLYFLLGLSGGGVIVCYALARELVPAGVSGMAIALVNTGLFLGAAIMQPGFGWMLDLTWDGTLIDGVRRYSMQDYRYGLGLSLGFAVLALCASLRLPETYCRHMSEPAPVSEKL